MIFGDIKGQKWSKNAKNAQKRAQVTISGKIFLWNDPRKPLYFIIVSGRETLVLSKSDFKPGAPIKFQDLWRFPWKKSIFCYFSRFFAIFSNFYARYFPLDDVKLHKNVRKLLFLYNSEKKSGKKIFFQKKNFFPNPIFRNFRYLSIFKAKFGAVIGFWLTNRCNKPIDTNV